MTSLREVILPQSLNLLWQVNCLCFHWQPVASGISSDSALPVFFFFLPPGALSSVSPSSQIIVPGFVLTCHTAVHLGPTLASSIHHPLTPLSNFLSLFPSFCSRLWAFVDSERMCLVCRATWLKWIKVLETLSTKREDPCWCEQLDQLVLLIYVARNDNQQRWQKTSN